MNPPFTSTLLDSDRIGYQRATRPVFIRRASRGQVPKSVLGRWLANDRLYVHAYVGAIGRVLGSLELPDGVVGRETVNTRLFSWLVDALVGLRREEGFFLDAASEWDIDISVLDTDDDGRVPKAEKLPGLRQFEVIFAALAPPSPTAPLPWWEAAVVFFGTERCYLDAWTFARDELKGDGQGDADGGALRRALIPNWSSNEFASFVNEIGAVLDDTVDMVAEDVRAELVDRALSVWRRMLMAEEAFWPAMKDEAAGTA
ncbi:hypothetical protein XA68_17323 [Ophiocordyceps unilateralis]|uniref:Thiaminase-2/PQQC domain-containing protein n=1 Tax=Ophiocordyceps unilateralis TaxID=268505 RepID=A0A2A9P4Z8_OPHUN|nr:hypothetical protein XA68_17323 [Ophiocordyceps unilateralis]